MLVSSRSAQLSLFAPELPVPAPRINNTTPRPPSCTLNRAGILSVGPLLSEGSLEARVRRSFAIQANPYLTHAA